MMMTGRNSARTLGLALLASVSHAVTFSDDFAEDTTTASTSGTWWPNPPFTTETYGPIVPSRSIEAATTSLTGISSYTPTSYSSTSPPYPTSTANATLPACKSIQYDFPSGTGSDATKAQAVKDAYVYAWNGYVKYAFGYDELQPLNSSGINDWYGWGVTIVDGIDTAIVMNLTDIVATQLAFIATIDFNTTPDGPVEIFDTSIRYLGGLISAYDLLKSGQFPNDYDQSHVEALLTQAQSLANKIAFGFNTPTGIASTNVNFTSDQPVEGTYTVAATNVTYNSTNTASAGTFILDWARLADLTGNETYRTLTERGESYLVNPVPAPVYPGLPGTQFDVDTGALLSFDGGWHAGVDSFLEYLIKDYYYKVTDVTTEYKDFWLQATQSTQEHLALQPFGFPELTFISELDVNGSITYSEDDFTCFAGGNWLLGGKLLDMPQIIDLGIAATDSCHETYNTTVTGLGPIAWAWYNASNLAYDPMDDLDSAERKNAAARGFFIPDGDENWEFRPEAIESIFYAHRITGDARWAEYNWEIFQAINNTALNPIAYATVNNVDMPHGGSMSDNMDSFFFAEVLKYLYLTFADPDVVNLDQWVFNTECHPFLVQCGIGGIDDYSGAGANATASAGLKARFF